MKSDAVNDPFEGKTLWERLSLMCARPITCTADLTPVEVEALWNSGRGLPGKAAT